MLDLFIYVDAILKSHKDENLLDQEEKLIGKNFVGYNVVKDNDNMKYVGLVRRNKNMDVIVSMNKYIEEIIVWSEIWKIFTTPGEPKDFRLMKQQN